MTARVPGGVSAGGQFATSAHSEPAVVLTGVFPAGNPDSLEEKLGRALGERHGAVNSAANLALAQLVDRTRAQFPTAKAVRLEICYDTDGMELAGVVDGEGKVLAGNDYDSTPAQRSAYSEWVNQATGTRFNVAGLAQQLPQNDAHWWDHAQEAVLDEPDRAQWDVNLDGAVAAENLEERLSDAIAERSLAVNAVADLALAQIAERTRLQFPTAKTVRLESCADSDGMELSEVLNGHGNVLASMDHRASWNHRAAYSEWVSQGTGTRYNLSGLAQQLPETGLWWNHAEKAKQDDPETTRWDIDLDKLGS